MTIKTKYKPTDTISGHNQPSEGNKCHWQLWTASQEWAQKEADSKNTCRMSPIQRERQSKKAGREESAAVSPYGSKTLILVL